MLKDVQELLLSHFSPGKCVTAALHFQPRLLNIWVVSQSECDLWTMPPPFPSRWCYIWSVRWHQLHSSYLPFHKLKRKFVTITCYSAKHHCWPEALFRNFSCFSLVRNKLKRVFFLKCIIKTNLYFIQCNSTFFIKPNITKTITSFCLMPVNV